MKVIVTPWYFIFIFILIVGLAASLSIPLQLWAITFIAVSLAIFLLHEWVHVYVASRVGIEIGMVILDIGNNTTFFKRSQDPEKEARLYLAGALFDTALWGCLVIVLLVSAIRDHNALLFVIAVALVLLIIWSFGFESSDYQEYRKRTGEL